MAGASSDRRAIITEALHKIDELSARLEVAEKGDTEPIAVVGMACRLPGGVNSPDEFWRLLQDGRSGISRVPADRWDADAFYTEDYTVPGTICTTQGGFITSWQPDQFDAEFFGISPREAAAMDPQQRLVLEVAWEALENAGIPPHTIHGSQTSAFIGLTTNDYPLTFMEQVGPEDIDPYMSFGNAGNFAAGRLSYFLGVRGPAVVIDTACSSSLVSVHLACQSLRRRESDTALAAGVNLILSPANSIACSRFGMLSPDGQCKTFDAGADGYVRSEGCGVVVLKRLSDALSAGDRVLALVRGSAVNQDGASSGQTVPNGPAQQALIRQALAASRLQPSDIDYIEAHGTGTALGDPIELDALSAVFGDRNGSAPLVLGSVKTNLGHLESAAGIAGFIKTVLSVKHGHIPKHLNFEKLTPHASEGATQFTIAAQAAEWPAVGHARRAGVSSFGVSGTNAHIIIEQAPPPEPAMWEPDRPVTTLVVSAKTPERIASTAGALAQWMTGAGAGVGLTDVAHTVNHHRARQPKFATVCARDREEAITGLRALAGGEAAVGVVGPHDGPCRPGTVFVYSGQGSQWAGMGKQLLADEPAFADAIAKLEPVFLDKVGFSLLGVLNEAGPLVGIERIQPVLTGMQLALTELWRSYGVNPDAVIGHSMGEVAAAVVAGALTPDEGLRVIATRSKLMSRLAGQGAMALLELDAEATTSLIADYPNVTLAVFAAPGQTVIAGPPADVDALIAKVAQQTRLARRVEVDVASHHPTIDPILPELRSALADLAPATPTIPFISTVADEPTFDADYWVANVRQPVRFSQAVTAAGQNHATFIEMSPHPLLGHAVNQTLADVHHHFIPTLQRDAHDTHTFHTNFNAAHTVQPPATPHQPEPHPVLPATPWHHTSHWISISAKNRRGGLSPRGDWQYDFAWPVRPLSDDETGSWLVFVDDSHASAIVRALGDGTSVHLMSTSVLADDSAGPTLLDPLGSAANVLYAPDISSAQFDAEAGFQLFSAARRLTAALATMTHQPRLYILTRTAMSDDHDDPAYAILWGLGRTLALQHPDIWGGIVELDESALAEQTEGASDPGEELQGPIDEIKDVWRVCEPEQRRRLLRDHVGLLVAAVMGLPEGQRLNPRADFFELGMDSLMSVLLQRALDATLDVVVEQPVIFDYPTVEELADYLTTIAAADRDAVHAYENLSEAAFSERVN
jgi:phthiocerol/phenolphthiocerol synthesis type-I polyketide synthase C